MANSTPYKHKTTIINCLKCRKPFKSTDYTRNRLCKLCNDQNRKEPKETEVLTSNGKSHLDRV